VKINPIFAKKAFYINCVSCAVKVRRHSSKHKYCVSCALAARAIRKASPAYQKVLIECRQDWLDKNPDRYLYITAKSRAKKRGKDFTLSAPLPIPNTCPVLGLPLKLNIPLTQHRPLNSPSYDCVDPTVGYVKDNVRVISYRANMLKNDGTADEICRVYKYVQREVMFRKGMYFI
jgi:hypothetical protein